jgi:hypothetical protein
MNDPRKDLGPYWLQTATPFGMTPQPPGLPPKPWLELPPINQPLLDMWRSANMPIPPAQAPWLPSGGPPSATVDHLDSAKYWGAAPAASVDSARPYVPGGGILGDFGRSPPSSLDSPAAPLGRGILGDFGANAAFYPAQPGPASWATIPPPADYLDSDEYSGGTRAQSRPGTQPSAPGTSTQSRNTFDGGDLAKSLGIGLAQGLISMPGIFGDARELFAHGARTLADYVAPGYGPTVETAVSRGLRLLPNMAGPSSSDIRALIEPVTGQFYQPQTVAGDYARTAGEFVPGMLAPGGVARNAARYVVAPALASETAGQLTQGTWAEPWARAIAALATGGVGAAIEHLPRGGWRGAPRVEQPPRSGAAGEMPSSTEPMPRPVDASPPLESLSSKSAGLFEPPAKPPRPYRADYPWVDPADASGRLVADIEGRPLTAKYIAGRRMAGGKDVGLEPQEIHSIIEHTIGMPPELMSDIEMGGENGVYLPRHDEKGLPTQPDMFINNELTDQQKQLVMAHEASHMIEDHAVGPGKVPIRGLESELEPVYSTLNSGVEGREPLLLPKDRGYSEHESPYELVAEGMRAYLTNPNYFKEVAPKSAAAFRAFFNSHPQLSKWIQFNGLGGLAVLGGANGSIPDDKSGR